MVDEAGAGVKTVELVVKEETEEEDTDELVDEDS